MSCTHTYHTNEFSTVRYAVLGENYSHRATFASTFAIFAIIVR